MKRIAFTIFGLLAGLFLSAQTYLSTSYSYYNTAGTFAQNSMATVEVGTYVHNVASLGIAAGITSFSGGKAYVEFRPSLILWTNNQFALTGTLGGGYIFDSPESFLAEYCGTFSYTLKDGNTVSAFMGGYKFSGKRSASAYSFSGIELTFNISKPK